MGSLSMDKKRLNQGILVYIEYTYWCHHTHKC